VNDTRRVSIKARDGREIPLPQRRLALQVYEPGRVLAKRSNELVPGLCVLDRCIANTVEHEIPADPVRHGPGGAVELHGLACLRKKITTRQREWRDLPSTNHLWKQHGIDFIDISFGLLQAAVVVLFHIWFVFDEFQVDSRMGGLE